MERVMEASELTIPIPLPGGRRWVVLTVPRPMSEAEWQHVLAVLDAMRPGLVAPTVPSCPAVSADVRDPDQSSEERS